MTEAHDRTLIRLCNFGMMCVALGPALFPVYLTTFGAVFGGLDVGQLGRLAGTLFAGVICGIVATGPLADRRGARPFAIAGSALTVLGLTLVAAAWSYGSLLLAAFITGLGGGIIDMVMSPIVSALAGGKRAAALNRLHAFYCIGMIGTLAMASALLRIDAPWRLVFLGATLFPALVCLGFALNRVPPLIDAGAERQGLRSLVRRPSFLLLLLTIGLVGATEEGMAQWLPTYAERVLGFSKPTAAAALAGFAVAMGLGRWFAGHYAEDVAPRRLIMVGATLCGVGFLVGAIAAPVPAVALAACVSVGFVCSLLWPTCLALAADTFPQGGATLFAALAAAGNAGCLVAPFLGGFLAEFNGLRVALGIGAVYPLLLAGLMVTRRAR